MTPLNEHEVVAVAKHLERLKREAEFWRKRYIGAVLVCGASALILAALIVVAFLKF